MYLEHVSFNVIQENDIYLVLNSKKNMKILLFDEHRDLKEINFDRIYDPIAINYEIWPYNFKTIPPQHSIKECLLLFLDDETNFISHLNFITKLAKSIFWGYKLNNRNFTLEKGNDDKLNSIFSSCTILDDIHYLTIRIIWSLEEHLDVKEDIDIDKLNNIMEMLENLILVDEFDVYNKYCQEILNFIEDPFNMEQNYMFNLTCCLPNFTQHLNEIDENLILVQKFILVGYMYFPIIHLPYYSHILKQLKILLNQMPEDESVDNVKGKIDNSLRVLRELNDRILNILPKSLNQQFRKILDFCANTEDEGDLKSTLFNLNYNKTDCIDGWYDVTNASFKDNSDTKKGSEKIIRPTENESLLIEGNLLVAHTHSYSDSVPKPENFKERYAFVWENSLFAICKIHKHSPLKSTSIRTKPDLVAQTLANDFLRLRRTSLDALISIINPGPPNKLVDTEGILGLNFPVKQCQSVADFSGDQILLRNGRASSPDGGAVNVIGKDNYQPEFKIVDFCYLRNCRISEYPKIPYTFRVRSDDNRIDIYCQATDANDYNGWMSIILVLNVKSSLNSKIMAFTKMESEYETDLLLSIIKPKYRFAVKDEPSNITLEYKPNSEIPIVKAATIDKLIERLTYPKYSDPSYLSIFLIVYRRFIKPIELFEALMDRYCIPAFEGTSFNQDLVNILFTKQSSLGIIPNEEFINTLTKEMLTKFKKDYVIPVQLRVLNVLRHWLNYHVYDFHRDATLYTKLKEFLQTLAENHKFKRYLEMMLRLMNKKLEVPEKPLELIFPTSPPPIEWHLTRDITDFNIITLHPVEFARQLSLYEFELYKTIKPSELVGTAWTKEDKYTTSPNLLKMTQHSTKITYWLEKVILQTRNLEERIATVNRILEILLVLHELNNFNGLLEIISALNSAPVYRLNHTFANVSPKVMKIYHDICKVMLDRHFKLYRERLKLIDPPCVPFLGVYMSDILHLEDGNPDFISAAPNTNKAVDGNPNLSLENGDFTCSTSSSSLPLINFNKWSKVAQICKDIQSYQNTPYHLQLEPSIRDFIVNINPFDKVNQRDMDDLLYNISLQIEPKEAKILSDFPKIYPNSVSLKSPGVHKFKSKTADLAQLLLVVDGASKQDTSNNTLSLLASGNKSSHLMNFTALGESLEEMFNPPHFKKIFSKRGASAIPTFNQCNGPKSQNDKHFNSSNKKKKKATRISGTTLLNLSPISPTDSLAPLISSPFIHQPSISSLLIKPTTLLPHQQVPAPSCFTFNIDQKTPDTAIIKPYFFKFPPEFLFDSSNSSIPGIQHSDFSDTNHATTSNQLSIQDRNRTADSSNDGVNNQKANSPYDLIVMSPPPLMPRLDRCNGSIKQQPPLLPPKHKVSQHDPDNLDLHRLIINAPPPLPPPKVIRSLKDSHEFRKSLKKHAKVLQKNT